MKHTAERNSTPSVSDERNQINTLADYRFNAVLYPQNISFKGYNTVKKTVQPMLDTCHYGKKSLFKHMEDLTIRTENGERYLEGFYRDDDDEGEICGICEELTQKAGFRLSEIFKDDYFVLALQTKGTKYQFDSHLCICMVKKNKKNQAILAKISEMNSIHKRIKDLESELYVDPNNHEKQAEYEELKDLYEMKARANKKRIKNSDFWEDAIFIDPSFNVITKMRKHPKDYKFSAFNTLESNNPYEHSKQIPEQGTKTPLGFVHDISPELESDYHAAPDSIVLFGLSDSDINKLDIQILDPSNKSNSTLHSNMLYEYYPDEEITHLVNRIESELQRTVA